MVFASRQVPPSRRLRSANSKMGEMASENSLGSPAASCRPVLILGGSGFIGSRLAAELNSAGLRFRIGDKKISEIYPEQSRQCDVRDRSTLRPLCEGVETIVNLAAEHRDDVQPESLYYETNVRGAVEICAVAREFGISRLIFTSSVAVYGFHNRPIDEAGPFAPFNAYGRTKLEAEGVYRAWADEDASRTLVVVRPTVGFGEGNRGNVYNLMRQIASGRFVMIGPGTNRKSMAYVGNVADFLVHTLSLGPGIHISNYVDGPDLDMNSLVALIDRAMNRKPGRNLRIPRPVAMAGGVLLDCMASLTGRSFPVKAIRIRKFCESTRFIAAGLRETEFVPRYALEQAVARTVRSEFAAL